MDKISKLLDMMNGKEVHAYAMNLLESCEFKAADDFEKNYFPSMDYERGVDFHNAHNEYLVNIIRKYNKIIWKHKLAILQGERIAIVQLFNMGLAHEIYDREGDETANEKFLLFMIISLDIKSSWRDIIKACEPFEDKSEFFKKMKEFAEFYIIYENQIKDTVESCDKIEKDWHYPTQTPKELAKLSRLYEEPAPFFENMIERDVINKKGIQNEDAK